MTINKTDRLGLRVPDIGTLNWGDEANDNTEIISSILSNIQVGNGVKYGLLASDGGTLQLDYEAGAAFVGGEEFIITAGNKTATELTGGAATLQRNFLYVDSSGVVQISTTAPSGEYALLAMADCDPTEIVAVYGCRHLLAVTSGMKNKIINGNFDIWQRSWSPVIIIDQTDSYEAADRFRHWHNGSTVGNHTISRQAFPLGQVDVPCNPKYYHRIALTTLGTGETVFDLRQSIEGVETFAGKKVTVSFYAKKSGISGSIGIILQQIFGTGGSPSPSESSSTYGSTVLTTSWQKIIGTITLGSISGKILGTNGNDELNLVLRSSTIANGDVIDIAQVQIEEGGVATPFEDRSIGEELALCQRYYEKSYNYTVTPGTASNIGAETEYETRNRVDRTKGASFKVFKRTTPSISIYSTLVGTIGNVENSGDKVASVSNIGQNGFLNLVISGGTVSASASYQWVADAEL